MEAILKRITETYGRRYEDIRDWKNAGNGKVIGCLPMYFPEEFVHAAGIYPVTLLGDDDPITLADRHLMTNSCGAMRGAFENLLAGRYDFLDGIAALLVCDQVRFFFEVWRLDYEIKFFHQMWRPYTIDTVSRPFLLAELKRLCSALEKFSERTISNDDLWRSFNLYNETRRLMRKLYELRRNHPGVISASDLIQTITAGMVLPKEKYNPMLKDLLTHIEAKEFQPTIQLKLLVAGHPCAVPDLQLLNLIEDLGGVIVDDDFFSGNRYCENDIEVGDDPVEAYANYCMNALPCTTHHNPENWAGEGKTFSTYGDWLVDKAQTKEVQGVILLQEMYCDPFDLEFVMLKKRFEERMIPYLSLPTGQGREPLEPQRTRIQGFLEMINP